MGVVVQYNSDTGGRRSGGDTGLLAGSGATAAQAGGLSSSSDDKVVRGCFAIRCIVSKIKLQEPL